MRTRALLALFLGSLAVVPSGGVEAAEGHLADAVNRHVLRVCATPGNLPYSNEKGEGFENKIAEVFAAELGRPVEYTWYPQGLGLIRMTLAARRCDVVMGTVQADEYTLNTNHYYRTTYALITKKGSGIDDVSSIYDPKLKGKKIGVQAGAPAADHVARAGLMTTARPYRFMVDTRHESPPREMIADIEKGEIDVGVLWGPFAGHYAKEFDDLVVTPIVEPRRPGTERLDYRITLGVRAGEVEWKHELNDVITKRQGDIDRILLDYGVPIIDEDNQLITEPRGPVKGTN